MKKLVIRILLGLLFIVLTCLSLKYDSISYDLGCGCLLCNNTMPYNVKPRFNYEYPQGYVLMDDDGFELVGEGFRYKNSSSKIEKFLGYGYGDTSILVKYVDSLSNINYLVSYETGHKSGKGNPEISFEQISKSDFELIGKSHKWVELKEGKVESVTRKRILFFIGAILSLLLLSWTIRR